MYCMKHIDFVDPTEETEMADVADLTNGDLYSTISQLIQGAENVSGVEINEVEFDDDGIDVILGDPAGGERRVSLVITNS